jgi:hypothetical protein
MAGSMAVGTGTAHAGGSARSARLGHPGTVRRVRHRGNAPARTVATIRTIEVADDGAPGRRPKAGRQGSWPRRSWTRACLRAQDGDGIEWAPEATTSARRGLPWLDRSGRGSRRIHPGPERQSPREMAWTTSSAPTASPIGRPGDGRASVSPAEKRQDDLFGGDDVFVSQPTVLAMGSGEWSPDATANQGRLRVGADSARSVRRSVRPAPTRTAKETGDGQP